MRFRPAILSLVSLIVLASSFAAAQSCPIRPAAGGTVFNPASRSSVNGVLAAKVTIRDYNYGIPLYCLLFEDGTEANTLRLNPGDTLQLTFYNALQPYNNGLAKATPAAEDHMHGMNHAGAASTDPCHGTMTPLSSNLHFHGLNVPPVCHQDEVIDTLINPGDPGFEYKIKIPKDEPPGIYWYHPHAHGLTLTQIIGGASGVIVVEGIEKLKPEVAGLTEKILVLRNEPARSGDPDGGDTTVNFTPGNYPIQPAVGIEMKPGERQFWRVLNANGRTFQRLQLQTNGVPLMFEQISVDGVPLKKNKMTDTIFIPPAGRAEFIVTAPTSTALVPLLSTIGTYTGVNGDPNPAKVLAKVVFVTDSASEAKLKPSTGKVDGKRFEGLATAVVTATRSLYFSEDFVNGRFFITVDGQTPRVFEPSEPPRIVTTQGAVEDWTIENRSQETHAFHMHQIHFLLMARDGVPEPVQVVQDTTAVPAWSGQGAYPSITIRLDFRNPETLGTFLYHCHILDHEDGGMMAKIQVNPAAK